ncbi:hypothetical protein L1281_000048 [Neisseria sp. HSC-16F19]|nr:DUF3465 domain-containing protein [Neisseria sp. HSC-16F19]MCP2039483.1 hypothetical protein [Neisseria sp. HSC-16F19]
MNIRIPKRYQKWLLLPVALWLVWQFVTQQDGATQSVQGGAGQQTTAATPSAAPVGGHTPASAFAARLSKVQMQGEGRVIKTLPDDNEGSRHQRFILKQADGHTVLVAHNIDLAPRLEGLKKGDTVGFYGVYEYNERGGVIHWTHHDPRGRHIDGWLEYRGKRYQ